MGGLNLAEAAEYAGYLLAPFPAARQQRERRSFGELLEWLDGHPLAMRLTLPRLETADPADLLAGLRGTTPLPGADDAGPGRLSSLGACITYSFTHLTRQARQLLPAVSLFHGIADESLLTALSAAGTAPAPFAGISRQEWTEVLQDAARVGLVTGLGAGMYRIHPALPGYLAAGWRADSPKGYGQARDACEQALRAACAALSEQLTEQIGAGDAAQAYTLIGLQRRTLGAMLGHALDHHAWDDANRIVRALGPYWDARGLDGEAAAWNDRILAATTTGPGQDPFVPAQSLWLHTTIQQANWQKKAGRPDQAAQAYQHAFAYLQDQPATDWTRASISALCNQLGTAARARERLDEADDWFRKSLAISEEFGNRPFMANSYHELGITAQARGRLDEAEDWYRKSLAIKEDLGDRPGMAGAYHQLGITAQHRGRLDEADDWYRKSLAIREGLGDRLDMASTCHQLGNTAFLRGRLDEAEDWYRKSLAISEELGNRPGMSFTYQQLGILAHDRGRLDEAEEWHRKSLAIKEELGDRLGMAMTLHELGITAQARGRLDEADDWCRKSLAISEELGNRPHMARVYHQLGNTAYLRGRLDKAEDWYRKSLAISEELGNRPVMALTYAQLGLVAEARAQAARALAWNIRCVTLFSEFPSPLTGSGPAALARLTGQLGMPVLEHAWQQVTGQPLPRQVPDYIISQHNDESSQP